MVKIRERSREIREKVVKFNGEGMSVREISRRLDVPKSTVHNILQKFKKTGTVRNLAGRGRKRKTTQRTDHQIKQLAIKNRKISAAKIAAEVKMATETEICPQTVRNRLNQTGLHGCVPRKKPLISKRNKTKRLNFAREHVNKPPEFWQSILWSDESKFNIFGSDGRGRVWRSKAETLRTECLRPTVKHGGGNVMVWGCMSSKGLGRLHFIDGIMNSDMYIEILRDQMLPSAREVMGRRYLFQHDNDPKHTSKKVTAFLKQKKVKLLAWPPQSPDLNPIEHLWEEMERRRVEKNARNRQELKDVLRRVWEEIDQRICQNLVESMPRRLEAVIAAKGGPTKY